MSKGKILFSDSNRFVEVEVGSPRLGWGWDKENKSLGLAVIRDTNFQNIIWMVFLTLKWRWPPWKLIICYTEA